MATLYKYRDLSNWKFVLDILVNRRLHAAPFTALNDPMEGRYFYYGNEVSRAFRKAVTAGKTSRKICSLSREIGNTLLWSYYANGHTGVAFSVRINRISNPGIEIEPIRYDNSIYIGRSEARGSADRAALAVLTQKQEAWSHESEVRVFSRANFVKVSIAEIILGCRIESSDEDLIKALAAKWAPRAKIRKMREKELDNPVI